ncbi:hypothetical protein [Marinobacter sp. C2H3]|uniref:hypothetical protein n=1 Tax=Marinobacter sp. C2H3 TaxID=3119003 RepID=UPI00300EBA23
MKKPSRASFLLVILPLAFFAVLGGVIFGGQAWSEHQENGDIRQAISSSLPSGKPVELANLERTQHGYVVCGTYRTADNRGGFSSFYYDAVNRRVVLDVQSRVFEENCGLATLCDN